VGIERVALKHHGDIALGGRQVVHDALADMDDARGHALEPGNHAKQGGFPAPGGSHEHNELAVRNVDVHTMDHVDGAERLAEVSDANLSHFSPLSPCPAHVSGGDVRVMPIRSGRPIH
jgi:hypothetical protein